VTARATSREQFGRAVCRSSLFLRKYTRRLTHGAIAGTVLVPVCAAAATFRTATVGRSVPASVSYKNQRRSNRFVSVFGLARECGSKTAAPKGNEAVVSICSDAGLGTVTSSTKPARRFWGVRSVEALTLRNPPSRRGTEEPLVLSKLN
jgi:hypothetical protein